MPGGIHAGKKSFFISVIRFIGIVELLQKIMFLIRDQLLESFYCGHIVVQGVLMVLPGKIVVDYQNQHGDDKKNEKNNKPVYIGYKMHFMVSMFFSLHDSPRCLYYKIVIVRTSLNYYIYNSHHRLATFR